MKFIRLQYPQLMIKKDLPPLSMALGYFDGVHLGHQEVIKEAKQAADQKGLSPAVMTFDPHPSVVLGRNVQHVQYITPLTEKIKLMESLGIEYLFIVNFTLEFANLLPQEFIDQYIIGLNVKHVVAGFDYTYGRMGKGTMETLPFHSREEFTYTVVPKYVDANEKVSSTRIRSLLKEGETGHLPKLLGRYYTTTGTVVHGDKRGRTIGFPTANIDLDQEYIIPRLGVYAVKFKINQVWYNGVCNVGVKPTFNQSPSKPSIEVHIFDFNEDIYGAEVTVEWHQFIRTEQKFSGIKELVAQIEQDKLKALKYFEEKSRHICK